MHTFPLVHCQGSQILLRLGVLEDTELVLKNLSGDSVEYIKYSDVKSIDVDEPSSTLMRIVTLNEVFVFWTMCRDSLIYKVSKKLSREILFQGSATLSKYLTKHKNIDLSLSFGVFGIDNTNVGHLHTLKLEQSTIYHVFDVAESRFSCHSYADIESFDFERVDLQSLMLPLDEVPHLNFPQLLNANKHGILQINYFGDSSYRFLVTDLLHSHIVIAAIMGRTALIRKRAKQSDNAELGFPTANVILEHANWDDLSDDDDLLPTEDEFKQSDFWRYLQLQETIEFGVVRPDIGFYDMTTDMGFDKAEIDRISQFGLKRVDLAFFFPQRLEDEITVRRNYYLSCLIRGNWFFKHIKKGVGKGHYRFFAFNPFSRELCWSRSECNPHTGIQEVLLGGVDSAERSTAVGAVFDACPFYRRMRVTSFSISERPPFVYRGRELSKLQSLLTLRLTDGKNEMYIVATSKQEYKDWIMGLHIAMHDF
ncbi:hypothetical protein PCE1_003773 [Barthelona sp. PCE]